MPLLVEAKRGDGPFLRAFFEAYGQGWRSFDEWVVTVVQIAARHDTLEGFACGVSLSLSAAAPP